MNLSEMRGRLRKDLHDEDPANQRWTDGELDRHIQRAVRDFSLSAPLEAKTTLSTTAGSRDLSIAGLTDLVAIEAVEYPVGQYPPSYVRFSVWLTTLTLLIDPAPAAAENASVYYTKLHTIDATSSTVPSRFEDVIAAGAGGYAALEWASFATNRVNVGGQDVWRDYLTWGQERLGEYQRALARHSRRNAVRARRLYAPALLAAQKSGPAVPYLKVVVSDRIGGVRRLAFSRLYTGSEPDGYHAAAMPADGSLLRARVSGGRVYYQRVTNPGAGSNFSAWTDLDAAANAR